MVISTRFLAVTEQSCAAPISKVEKVFVLYPIDFRVGAQSYLASDCEQRLKLYTFICLCLDPFVYHTCSTHYHDYLLTAFFDVAASSFLSGPLTILTLGVWWWIRACSFPDLFSSTARFVTFGPVSPFTPLSIVW